MNRYEQQEYERGMLEAGYIRGLLGLPLDVDDVNLTREQLEAKYMERLRTPQKVIQECLSAGQECAWVRKGMASPKRIKMPSKGPKL